MTTRFIPAVLLFGSLCTSEAAEIPASLPIARYEKMLRKSPFALATPSEPAEAPTPPFAANLYVSGIAKIGEGDLVTVRTRDQSQSFSISASDSGPDGITLVNVQWVEQVGRSKVTLRKGTETAVIEFDQSVIQKPAAPIPMPGHSSHSGHNGPRAIALPPGAATTVAPAPSNFPQVSGPVETQQPGGRGPGDSHGGQRRIRIIPSRPTQ